MNSMTNTVTVVTSNLSVMNSMTCTVTAVKSNPFVINAIANTLVTSNLTQWLTFITSNLPVEDPNFQNS